MRRHTGGRTVRKVTFKRCTVDVRAAIHQVCPTNPATGSAPRARISDPDTPAPLGPTVHAMASHVASSSFGKLLATAREQGGWSRREIAEAAGISTQFVTYLESGERHPSPDTIERLITAMDLPPRRAALLRQLGARHR